MSEPPEERALTHWDVMDKEAVGSWAENHRLARAMRRVIEGLVKIDAPEAELRPAAEALERYAERLAAYPKRTRPPGYTEAVTAGSTAAFDEVLGYAQSVAGNPGMTDTLTVRYRSPTPLHTELAFQANVTRAERRRTYAAGTLRAGEVLCASTGGVSASGARLPARRATACASCQP